MSAASLGNRTTSSSGKCPTSHAMGTIYSSFHFGIVIFLHCTAFGLNFYALQVAIQKSAQRADVTRLLREERRRIRIVLTISACSVVLIAIPNALLFCLVLNIFVDPLKIFLIRYMGYFNILFCINSAINLLIYVLFSRNFRLRVIELVRCHR